MEGGERHPNNMNRGVFEQGDVITNRYKVVRLVGTGGMGMVYLVEDLLLNNQHLSLKVLHPHYLQNDEHVHRFLREVELTRTLNSPFVVRTFDVGRQGNSLYFTMEYLEGCTLEERLKQGPLTSSEAMKILHHVCGGLDAIHQHGIVHRDLKPANIFLSNKEQVKLMDFGLARPFDSKLTTQSSSFGTAAYMGPEVWKGETVTHKTDLYAFGVIIYEVFCGILPYNADSSASLMFQHIEGPVPSLSPQRAEQFPGIDDLIQALMAKLPDHRPESALQVLQQIEQLSPQGFSDTQIHPTVHKIKKKRRIVPSANIAITIIVFLTPVLITAYFVLPMIVRKQSAVERSSPQIERGGTAASVSPQELFLRSLLWLEASSIPADPGQPVSLWESSARLEFTVQQTIPKRRPRLAIHPSIGRKVLDFNGHNQFLESMAVGQQLSKLREMTIMYVISVRPSKRQQFVWSTHFSEGQQILSRAGFSTDERKKLNLSSEEANFDFDSQRLKGLGNLNLFAFVYSPTLCTGFMNGKKILTAPIRTPLAYRKTRKFFIGQELDVNRKTKVLRFSDFFNGQMAEFIVFKHALSKEEQRAGEQYLANKYNLKLES
jgi:serine/threonine protein kinase